MGKIINCCAVLVAFVAAFIGACLAGLPRKLGLFTYYDKNFYMERGTIPAMLEGQEWGFQFSDIPDLTGKTALVTGPSLNGLGYWTALHLARKGADVTLACRSMERCEKAASAIRANFTGAKVTSRILDLASLVSVRAFASEYISANSGGHGLDMLVLNAAVMACPFELSPDGVELQFATNHLGHFLLTELLLGEVKKAPHATITVVASAAHNYAYPEGVRLTLETLNDASRYDPSGAYGQSKLANVLYAKELAERLKSTNVHVNVIHPGLVATELGRYIKETPIGPYIVPMLMSMAWTPEEGSLTQIFTAVSPRIQTEDIRGQYFHPVARINPTSAHGANVTMQKLLWTFTEELLAQRAPRA